MVDPLPIPSRSNPTAGKLYVIIFNAKDFMQGFYYLSWLDNLSLFDRYVNRFFQNKLVNFEFHTFFDKFLWYALISFAIRFQIDL